MQKNQMENIKIRKYDMLKSKGKNTIKKKKDKILTKKKEIKNNHKTDLTSEKMKNDRARKLSKIDK